jgi:hypothetical protein
MIIAIWLMTGFWIWCYYWGLNCKKYIKDLNDGKTHVFPNLFLGAVLTFIAWPVTIYTNEFKK